MKTKVSQLEKLPTRQLGCRANAREEAVLDVAARLDNRDRNKFILVAALEAARVVLQKHGTSEEEVLKNCLK
jgi:uncharacterized protein (DUF1778 family)